MHLALVHPSTDIDTSRVSLDLAAGVVKSISVHSLPDWNATSDRFPKLPWVAGAWVDFARYGSADAAAACRAR